MLLPGGRYHHQMPLAGGGGYPGYPAYPMVHMIYLPPPHVNRHAPVENHFPTTSLVVGNESQFAHPQLTILAQLFNKPLWQISDGFLVSFWQRPSHWDPCTTVGLTTFNLGCGILAFPLCMEISQRTCRH